MKTFQKGIAKVLFYVISGALLIYAASRSLDFIVSTLPGQDQFIGFLGLAATSGGMVSWLLVFLYSADGLGQKITAALMVAIDLLGEIALFTFDTLYRSGKNGLTAELAPDEIRLVVLMLSALIALNILATVVFHLVEPENMRRMRESFVRDHLENEALKQIEKHGEEIAHSLAPALAQQWRDDFEARFSDLRSLGLGTVNQLDEPRSAPKKQPRFSLFPTSTTAPAPEAVPTVPLAPPNPNGHK